jgi:hypothetical protein
MPILPNSEVVARTAKLDQNQNPASHVTPTKTSVKTPDRTTTSKSPKQLHRLTIAGAPSAAYLERTDLMAPESASFGILGFQLHGNVANVTTGHLEAAMLKHENSTHDQTENRLLPDKALLSETPVALGRSLSMPSPEVSNSVELPKLNRSNSNGEPGAAIKAALGSSLFSTFRKTSFTSVLEKIKTAVDEQMDVTNDTKFNFAQRIQSAVVGNIQIAAQEPANWEIGRGCSDTTQSSGPDVHPKDIESESNLTTATISYQKQRKDSEFLEESAEMMEAWSRMAKERTPTKSIQKIWNFEPIPEPPVRPYSGLKRNADAARRPSSASSFNFSLEDVEFINRTPTLTGTPRLQDGSGKIHHEQLHQVVDVMRSQNKRRERTSNGPGGFWRTGVHSASADVIQRKMSSFVANIPEVREQSLTCDVCFSYRSKDANGRCKKCAAQ